MVFALGKLAAAISLFLSISTAEAIRSIAVLSGPSARGNVTFTQDSDGGSVTVTGVISGLTPGLHGMHVHQKGDMTDGCRSTGPHFNPHNVNHGSMKSSPRHVGDLSNIYANVDGIATVALVDSHISLFPSSTNNIIGRALVIHAGEDDLGRGDFHDSLTSGHAGERIACGIIKIQ